jgi:hypothetical protein
LRFYPPVRSVAPLPLLLGLFVLCLLDVGCATVGRSFPAERVQSIVIGETTKSDLLGRFGRPYRRGIEDGDSTWTYLHYKFRVFGTRSDTRDLYVRFQGDKVRSYTYNADVP